MRVFTLQLGSGLARLGSFALVIGFTCATALLGSARLARQELSWDFLHAFWHIGLAHLLDEQLDRPAPHGLRVDPHGAQGDFVEPGRRHVVAIADDGNVLWDAQPGLPYGVDAMDGGGVGDGEHGRGRLRQPQQRLHLREPAVHAPFPLRDVLGAECDALGGQGPPVTIVAQLRVGRPGRAAQKGDAPVSQFQEMPCRQKRSLLVVADHRRARDVIEKTVHENE